jgi:hypothetical protein
LNGPRRGLAERVTELEQRLAELATLLAAPDRIVDDPPFESAVERARSYFIAHHGEIVQPDGLAHALGMSVGLAIEVCERLAQEDQIVEVE